MRDLKNRYLLALSGAGTRASTATDAFDTALTGFDPQAAFEKSAEGAYAGFRTRLKEDIGTLRGQQVGMGRLRTGFGQDDEDRLVDRSAERFENTLADRAMQTTGMRLNKLGMQGSYAEAQQNRYLDLLSGGLDRAQAEANAKRQSRNSLISAALGGVGMVGGAILGGPIGAGIGAKLGYGVGSRV